MSDQQLEQLDKELEAAPRLRLDPDLLTPHDLRRARDVLDGRNPWELLDDPIDRVTLTIWCLLSRDDPSFTWDQADNSPFGLFDTAGDDDRRPPPVTQSGSSTGTAPAKRNGAKPKGSPPSAASTT
jgi:hypothetical protein